MSPGRAYFISVSPLLYLEAEIYLIILLQNRSGFLLIDHLTPALYWWWQLGMLINDHHETSWTTILTLSANPDLSHELLLTPVFPFFKP